MNNITRIFIVLLLLSAAVKLTAQSCIALNNCPASPVQICDLTNNDPGFWNETYWLDPVTGLNNMSDAPTDLSLTATDTCVNGSTTIKFVLYLDLDGNGTQETAIGSDSLPGFNVVNYNNISAAGTLRAFDERPVLAGEKYGFAMESIVNGPTTTARVRWNTSAQPGTYVNPELPYGVHKIKWIISDALGQESTCEYNIATLDCKEPTVVCLNDVAINLMPTGQIQMWAVDFLQYMDDNYTPSNSLQVAIRKAGDGTGFPLDVFGNPALSVIFNCNDLGEQPIELWVRDQSGNAGYCQTFVTIMDDLNACANTADAVFCTKLWCNDAVIAGMDYGYGPVDSFDPATGCATFENFYALGAGYDIFPAKDGDDLNGVNTLDLIRISKHILGLQPLGSPYAMIAADANHSSSITTFDIVEYRKLIQGIYTELPNNTSWRFFDANADFFNPQNPFQGPWPDTFSYTLLDSVLHFDIVGVKNGDVDCSAYPGFAPPGADDRATANLTLTDATLLPGETLELPVRFSETGEWLGLQMGLHFDPDLFEIEAITPGNLSGLDETSFARPHPGSLNVVWFNTVPQAVMAKEDLFVLKIKALAPLRLSEALYLAKEKIASESYTAGEVIHRLQLQFTERTETFGEPVVSQPMPNPTAMGATIPLRLVQPETVTLELNDISGRQLWFNQLTLNYGTHLLDIPATALPQTGVYVWRVRAGKMSANGKLIKI